MSRWHSSKTLLVYKSWNPLRRNSRSIGGKWTHTHHHTQVLANCNHQLFVCDMVNCSTYLIASCTPTTSVVRFQNINDKEGTQALNSYLLNTHWVKQRRDILRNLTTETGLPSNIPTGAWKYSGRQNCSGHNMTGKSISLTQLWACLQNQLSWEYLKETISIADKLTTTLVEIHHKSVSLKQKHWHTAGE